MERERAQEVITKVEAFYREVSDRTPVGRRAILGQLTHLRGEVRSLTDDTYLWELFSKLEVACAELAKASVTSDQEERQLGFGHGDVAGMRARLVALGLLVG